jgi:hypothetical protein
MEPRRNMDEHGFLRQTHQLIVSSVRRVRRAVLAFAKFLEGATGITALHQAQGTKRQARVSYLLHVSRKYSRPSRCC